VRCIKEAAMAVGSVGSASSSSAAVTDLRDLNKDGKVTTEEILQYRLLHPETSSTGSASSTQSSSLFDVTV